MLLQDNSDGSETDRDVLVPLPAASAPHGLVQPSWPSYPTTYSNPPNLGPIYNPAPPPSTYMTFAGPNMNTNQSPRYWSVFSIYYFYHCFCCVSGSSGGGGGSIRQTLAASGSGSETDGGSEGNNIANLSISSYPKNLQGVTS